MPGKGSFEEQPTRAVANREGAILVAEDNPKDIFLLKRAFSQLGPNGVGIRRSPFNSFPPVDITSTSFI
jgi:hypothetical protein